MNQRGIAQLLLMVLLLIGIGVGVYLTQFTQVFKPKATEGIQTEFFLSPQGDDTNDGTITAPFKTLDRAKAAVRTVNQSGQRITVWLRAGTYELLNPFILEPEDSGFNGQYVVYQAYQNETVIISGGKRITNWTQEGDKWKAPAGGIQTRQLYVNGTRAVRARSEGPPPGMTVDKTTGFTTTDTSYQNFRNKTDMEVASNVIWRHYRCPVTSITSGNFVLRQPCWQGTQDYGQAFPKWIENAYELLDQPGEWYLDKAANMFYYKPKPGEDMTKAYIVAPVLETLIVGKGTPDNPVHHVAFQNLKFEYSTWLEPSVKGYLGGQSSVYLKPEGGFAVNHAALNFETARNISFVLNTLQRLGGAGIYFGYGSKENLIMGSHFTDISADAINLGDVDHHRNLENIPDKQITFGNQIFSNYVHKVGTEYFGSSGIAVLFAQATQVSHNEVAHLPYTAISLNNVPASDIPTISKNNRIANNLIYDLGKTMTDGGGIYVNALQPGSHITENVIYDQYSLPGAIYLDGAFSWNVTNNVVYNMHSAAPFHTTQTYPIRPLNGSGCGNSITNNYWTILPGPDGPPLIINKDIASQTCTTATTITNNTTINGPSEAPQAIVTKAGIQAEYKKIKSINLNPPVVTLFAPPEVSTRDTTLTFNWNFAYGADGFERVNPYEVGAPDSQPLASIYLNCTAQPSAPIYSGSCTIPNVLAGDTTKKYELRMFAKDGVTVIATSKPIEVTTQQTSASPSPSPSPQKIGDTDGDGDVDIFDFNNLVSDFGKTGTNLKGDLDQNGKVDIFDFNILVTNFNK